MVNLTEISDSVTLILLASFLNHFYWWYACSKSERQICMEKMHAYSDYFEPMNNSCGSGKSRHLHFKIFKTKLRYWFLQDVGERNWLCGLMHGEREELKVKKINIFLEFFFTRRIPDFFPVLTVIFYSHWFTGHLLWSNRLFWLSHKLC